MSKCTGLFGRLFGHEYAARYSLGKASVNPMKDDSFVGRIIFSSDIEGIVSASRPRTYHGDVCARCGHMVNAPSAQ